MFYSQGAHYGKNSRAHIRKLTMDACFQLYLLKVSGCLSNKFNNVSLYKPVAFISFYLRYIFFDLLLTVALADEEYIGGINYYKLLEAL